MKSLLKIFLTLLIIFTFHSNSQSQTLTLKVEPAYNTVGIDESFSVEVQIENVTNLGAFQFDIVYSTDVIHADGAEMGAFLGSTGRNVIPAGPDIDNSSAEGNIRYGGVSFGTNNGPDGSGVLATFTFTAQAAGNTQLTLQNIQVSDINAQILTVESVLAGQVVVSSGESNWIEQASGVSERLYFVDAVDQDVAWVVGSNRTVLRTTNGGDTWSSVSDALSSEIQNLYVVDAIDENTAFVATVTGDSNAGTNIALVYRTKNGGVSWTKVFELPSGWIDNLTMFSRNSGILIGDPINGFWTVYRTTDGGDNWTAITNPPSAGDNDWSGMNSFCWLDHLNGWFGTNTPDIYHTTDGGLNWNRETMPPLTRTTVVSFNQAGFGLVANILGQLLRVSNWGANSSEITPFEPGYIRHGTAQNDFFLLLIDSTAYKSTDNGQSWDWQFSANGALRNISIKTTAQGTVGWVVGSNGNIWKYWDGSITDIAREDNINIPGDYTLWQNYPNPFNPKTTFRFALPAEAHVKLEIFNTHGQRIVILLDKQMNVGQHEIVWNAGDLASGVYLCQLSLDETLHGRTGHYRDTKKVILLK